MVFYKYQYLAIKVGAVHYAMRKKNHHKAKFDTTSIDPQQKILPLSRKPFENMMGTDFTSIIMLFERDELFMSELNNLCLSNYPVWEPSMV